MKELQILLKHYQKKNINIIDMIQSYDNTISKADIQLYLIQSTIKNISFYKADDNIIKIINKLYQKLK
jgi:hypothetical protein